MCCIFCWFHRFSARFLVITVIAYFVVMVTCRDLQSIVSCMEIYRHLAYCLFVPFLPVSQIQSAFSILASMTYCVIVDSVSKVLDFMGSHCLLTHCLVSYFFDIDLVSK